MKVFNANINCSYRFMNLQQDNKITLFSDVPSRSYFLSQKTSVNI